MFHVPLDKKVISGSAELEKDCKTILTIQNNKVNSVNKNLYYLHTCLRAWVCVYVTEHCAQESVEQLCCKHTLRDSFDNCHSLTMLDST